MFLRFFTNVRNYYDISRLSLNIFFDYLLFLEAARTLCNISATNVTAKNSSNGKDHQARMMAGRVVTVKFVDDLGQIHLEESGLALIPGVDEFAPIGQEGI